MFQVKSWTEDAFENVSFKAYKATKVDLETAQWIINMVTRQLQSLTVSLIFIITINGDGKELVSGQDALKQAYSPHSHYTWQFSLHTLRRIYQVTCKLLQIILSLLRRKRSRHHLGKNPKNHQHGREIVPNQSTIQYP